MAGNQGWATLNAKQRKLAIQRWHQRQNANSTPASDPLDQYVAPGLTLRQLQQNTRAATQLKYSDAEAAQAQALQQNQLQAKRSQGWFSQYQQAIAHAAQQQAANTQAAVGGIQALQQGLDASSEKAWAGQQQAMSADAASRGATVNPQLADVAHNASSIRNALTGSYGAMVLSQGTNTKNALSDRGLTARQQGLEAQAAKQTERSNLYKDIVRLKREKGAFKQTYREQSINDASKRYLEGVLAAGQAASLDAKTQATLAGIDATKAGTAQARWDLAFEKKYGYKPSSLSPLDAWRLKFAKEHNHLPSTGARPGGKPKKADPASGPGSLTTAEEQKRVSQVRTVASLFKNGYVVKDNYGQVQRRIKPGDVEAMRKYLLTERAMNPLAVTVGLALYKNKGKLGRGGVKAAHQYGIHVGGNFEILPTSGVTGSVSAGGSGATGVSGSASA